MKIKQIIAILVCVIIALSLVACGEKGENVPSLETDNVQIPNPWTECASIEDAMEKAGFSFEVPVAIDGFNLDYVQNQGTKMIEVVFAASNNSDKSIRIRKGTKTRNVAGDYNDYSQSKYVTVGSYNVHLEGDQGLISLASWDYEEFSFSVSAPEMSEDAVVAIIQQIS